MSTITEKAEQLRATVRELGQELDERLYPLPFLSWYLIRKSKSAAIFPTLRALK